MDYTNDEETLKQLLQQAYKPVNPLPGEKELIMARIMTELDGYSKGERKPWARPRLMVPVLASIAGGLIAYGYLLSMTFV